MLLPGRIPKLIRFITPLLVLLLLLMTIYRVFFFFHYQPQDRPFSGSTLLLGIRYDLRVVGILGLVCLIAASFPFLYPFKNERTRKGWRIFLMLALFIFLLFYGIDFYYYDYLKQRLNASVINFLQDAAISFGMVWQTYPVIWISLAIAAILFFFGMVYNKFYFYLLGEPRHKASRKWHYGTYIAFTLLLATAVFGKLDQYPLRWSDAFSLGDDYKANVALNPFQSFFSSLKYKNAGYDLARVKKHYPLMAAYLGVERPDSSILNYERVINYTDTLVNKPNIVLVICESFSAYKSSMFGNKLNPTPFFNDLSAKGAFFERCFTPGFGTARGVWATITGIPDVASPNTASRNPAVVDQHTIINDFKAYDKFYFLGGSTTWANIRGLLTNNISGLRIYEQEDFKAKKIDVWGISDKNLFLEANRILAQQSKPFFSIIQTADNHRPYTIPAEDLDEFEKITVAEDSLKKYGFDDNAQYNAFRYTDFCFRKFMEAASKEKYYSNTVFIFVGDHGLRGDAGNMFPISFTKQGILAEHVPLLFYAPGLVTPARYASVASQLDILPSIAFLTRQSHRNTTMGRNLFDSLDKTPRFAFIADPDLQSIGLLSDAFYYSRNLVTNASAFVSVTNNDPVIPEQTDSLKTTMAQLTEAWYETARYLLFHNKKKN